MALAQQSIGQSVLLGCLALATAILGASARPAWACLPLGAAAPVAMGWLKLQIKLKRDKRDMRLQQLRSSQQGVDHP